MKRKLKHCTQTSEAMARQHKQKWRVSKHKCVEGKQAWQTNRAKHTEHETQTQAAMANND